MPPVYTYDHIHLRTTNPQATIEYYQKMFDATPVEYVQSNGKLIPGHIRLCQPSRI